jgi:hypothetical protein
MGVGAMKNDERELECAGSAGDLSYKLYRRQSYNAVFRIYCKKNTIGNGFFCRIIYQRKIIIALITNYHIINENIIKENEETIIAINNEVLIKEYVCVKMIIEDFISMKYII